MPNNFRIRTSGHARQAPNARKSCRSFQFWCILPRLHARPCGTSVIYKLLYRGMLPLVAVGLALQRSHGPCIMVRILVVGCRALCEAMGERPTKADRVTSAVCRGHSRDSGGLSCRRTATASRLPGQQPRHRTSENPRDQRGGRADHG